jgi:hypothetical protein
MIEKIMTVPAWRFRQKIGELDSLAMDIVGTRLAVVLGLA